MVECRTSERGVGDSILTQVAALCPCKIHLPPRSPGNTQEAVATQEAMAPSRHD